MVIEPEAYLCDPSEFQARLHLDRFTDSEVARIARAEHIAHQVHLGRRRRTGEDQIQHSLYVARSLAEWGQDADTIILGILHDTIEDCKDCECDRLKRDIIEHCGGSHMLRMLMYLTKSDKVAMEQQIRRGGRLYYQVPFTKLADRGHNLITVPLLDDDRVWQWDYLRVKTQRVVIPALRDCIPFIPDAHVELYRAKLDELIATTEEALEAVAALQQPLPLFS